MIQIRDATQDDVNELHTLGKSVSEFSVSAETVGFWPKNILLHAIASSDVLLLVAHEHHKIQGFTIASYNEGLKKATIENIFVAPQRRGEGIGNLLLNDLFKRLADKECEYVVTLIPDDAKKALDMYTRAGFTKGETFLWLDKSLSSQFKRV